MKTISRNIFLIISLLMSITACQQNGNSKAQSTSRKDSINQEERPQPIDTFFHKIKDPAASIVPGESIGKFKVGERLDSIPELRPADHGDAGMCKSLQQWKYGKNKEYTFTFFSECDGEDNMRPHLKWIRTDDVAFQTKKGLRVGNTLEEIKNVFDSLLLVATYKNKDSVPMNILTAKNRGITFEMTASSDSISSKDSCRAIIVHSITKQVPSMYFDFYKDLKLKVIPQSISKPHLSK